MIIGNLTRDPSVKYTPKGTAVAEIGIAINRKYSVDGEKREETTFVDVALFGKTAELAGQYLKKGKPVYIEGRLQNESWEDKATGQKRSKMRVVADSIQFLGGREGGEDDSQSRTAQRQPQRQVKPPVDPDLDIDDDDSIPF